MEVGRLEFGFQRFGIHIRVEKNIGGKGIVPPHQNLPENFILGFEGNHQLCGEMGIRGHVFVNPGDSEVHVLCTDVAGKDLSDRILLAEIFLGGSFGYNNGKGIDQGLF